MFYDTHAHLNIDYNDDEIKEIIKESNNKSIFVNIVGIDLETSIKSIEVSKMNPKHFFSLVGIHPLEASELSKEQIDDNINSLDTLINNNFEYIKGIGETGLDFFHIKDKKKIDMQFYSLKKHYELAIKYNLPLILHVRDAHEEAIEFLSKNKIKKVLIHCFSDKLIYAEQYIKLDCMLSIPGIATFKNAIDIHEVIKKISINNLVVETDSPYLSPVPFRGKKNTPLYIKYIVECIAKIKDIDFDEISEIIFKNSLNFFNI